MVLKVKDGVAYRVTFCCNILINYANLTEINFSLLQRFCTLLTIFEN